jgi:hypothetical protein
MRHAAPDKKIDWGPMKDLSLKEGEKIMVYPISNFDSPNKFSESYRKFPLHYCVRMSCLQVKVPSRAATTATKVEALNTEMNGAKGTSREAMLSTSEMIRQNAQERRSVA